MTFYLFFWLIGLLACLFLWALLIPKRRTRRPSWSIPDDPSRSHSAFLPQIRQAMAQADYRFIAERAPQEVSGQVRRERRRIALAYLCALREEFEGLLRTARVIAALSPEVAAIQELERLRLTLEFQWRYAVLWMSLWAGRTSLPQMNNLSNLLSGLNVRLEAAMKELGERAALVTEMVSFSNRRRVHPV